MLHEYYIFFVILLIVTFTPDLQILQYYPQFIITDQKKAMEYVYGATIAFGLLLGISAALRYCTGRSNTEGLACYAANRKLIYAAACLSDIQNGCIKASRRHKLRLLFPAF
jgi:hypothetical protein